MNILHLDLETTGLNPLLHSIVEVGAIYDPYPWILGRSVAEDLDIVLKLQRFWGVIRTADMVWDNYCLKLHTENGLLRLISGGKLPCECRELKSSAEFSTWLVNLLGSIGVAANGRNQKFVLHGKNVGSFDLQFLKAWLPADLVRTCFHYRVLDMGQMYMRWDGIDLVSPDVNECLARAGYVGEPMEEIDRAVSSLGTLHRALYDSVLCALLLRNHLRGIAR